MDGKLINLIQGSQFQQDSETGLIENSFKIQLSPDFVSTIRIPYSFIDWFLEVGAFSVAMYFVFRLLTGFFRSMSLDRYLVQRLYKRQD